MPSLKDEQQPAAHREQQWEGGYRFWSERTSEHTVLKRRPGPIQQMQERVRLGTMVRGRWRLRWPEAMHGLRGVPIIVIAVPR